MTGAGVSCLTTAMLLLAVSNRAGAFSFSYSSTSLGFTSLANRKTGADQMLVPGYRLNLLKLDSRRKKASHNVRKNSVHRFNSAVTCNVVTPVLDSRSAETVYHIRADDLFGEAVSIYESVARADQEKLLESSLSASTSNPTSLFTDSAALLDRTDKLVEAMRLLQQVFQLDEEDAAAAQYSFSGGLRSVTNVTCMRPVGR